MSVRGVERLQQTGSVLQGTSPVRPKDFRSLAPDYYEFETGLRRHPLVLVDAIYAIDKIPTDLQDVIFQRVRKLFSVVATTYLSYRYPILSSSDGKVSSLFKIGGEHYKAPQEASPHAVILNPVFLGQLSPAVEKALAEFPIDPTKNDERKFKRILREHLPETLPLGAVIGNQICKWLNIEPKFHPNFINVFFVDDSAEALKSASYRAKQLLFWSLMAKFGSFKHIVQTYHQTETGGFEFSNPILATLEGGHPELDLVELGNRLLVYGSVTEVKPAEVSDKTRRRLDQI